MILDNQAIFSDNQAITADCASTNVFKYKGDLAKGTPVEVLVQITEAFKSSEVDSIAVKVQTSAAENFTSSTDLITETLSAISLGTKANFKFLPKGNLGYLRLYYDVTFKSGVSASTEGKILAGIVTGVDESF